MRFVFSSCNEAVFSRQFCSVVLNRKYFVWRVFCNRAVCVTSIHISHSGHRWHNSCMTGSYLDWLLFTARRHAHRGGRILVSMLLCQAFLPFSPSSLSVSPPPPPHEKPDTQASLLMKVFASERPKMQHLHVAGTLGVSIWERCPSTWIVCLQWFDCIV